MAVTRQEVQDALYLMDAETHDKFASCLTSIVNADMKPDQMNQLREMLSAQVTKLRGHS